MALAPAADDVIVTLLAAVDVVPALVPGLVLVLRDQKLHLEDLQGTPTTSLVASLQPKKKHSKLDYVTNSSSQTNSKPSKW